MYVILTVVAVDSNTIRNSVLSGVRPQMCLIPADVPDFLKQIITECWAQQFQHRPLFNGLCNLRINLMKDSQDSVN